MLPGGLQQIHGAPAISRHILSRGLVRIGNGNQGGQVEDDFLALDHPGGVMRVGEVPQDHFDLIFDRSRQQFQQPPVIPGIIGPGPGTRAPNSTNRSARWLPMNPPAPVTKTPVYFAMPYRTK